MTEPMNIPSPPFTCVSWNVHRGRANDGRFDPVRMLDVLRTEVWRSGAEALFLQEADAEAAPHAGVLDIAQVERITGLRHVQTSPASRSTEQSHGFQGVVVYLHSEVVVDDLHLISLPGMCPRGAVVVDATRANQKLRLIGTHLSLSQALRMAQMRIIGRHVAKLDQRPLILCGDLNEWRPWGGLALSRRVNGLNLKGPKRRSFPTRFPILPLDRVLTTMPGRVEGMEVLNGPGIRAASDHRPIVAQVYLAS